MAGASPNTEVTRARLSEEKGTAERNPLSEAALGRMIQLARAGLEQIFAIPRKRSEAPDRTPERFHDQFVRQSFVLSTVNC